MNYVAGVNMATYKEIQMYIMGGYTIRHKSEKRIKSAKERAEAEKEKIVNIEGVIENLKKRRVIQGNLQYLNLQKKVKIIL